MNACLRRDSQRAKPPPVLPGKKLAPPPLVVMIPLTLALYLWPLAEPEKAIEPVLTDIIAPEIAVANSVNVGVPETVHVLPLPPYDIREP